MARVALDFEQNVFINCPFDGEYRPLLDAIVFTVQITGFKSRCALEASNAGQFRLEKIMQIVESCQFGIHDLSRIELSRNGLPRFNMPLELGLDLGCRRFGTRQLRQKRLLVLDRSRIRYQKFISDIAGQDVVSHGNSPRKLIACVRDWLATECRSKSLPGGSYIHGRYRGFQRALPILRDRLRLHTDHLTFVDYLDIVAVWLEEMEPGEAAPPGHLLVPAD